MGHLCCYNSLRSKTDASVVNNFFLLDLNGVMQANLKRCICAVITVSS